MEPNIWIRDASNHYEYIAIYIDDLLIVSKDPQSVTNILMKKNRLKLKGTSPIKYYLGCDF